MGSRVNKTYQPNFLHAYSQGLLFGLMTLFAVPGIGWGWLYPLALTLLCRATLQFHFWHLRGALWLGWWLGACLNFFMASKVWGWYVPLLLSLIPILLHTLPLGLILVYSRRHALSGYQVFGVVGLGWCLYLSVLDLLGLPLFAAFFFSDNSWVIGSVRLVGSAAVSSIIVAAVASSGYLSTLELPWSTRIRQSVYLNATGITVLVILSGVATHTLPPANGSLSVGIPQPNAGHDYYQHRHHFPEIQITFDKTFQTLMSELESADMVITTEQYDGRYHLLFPKQIERLERRARHHKQQILLSAPLLSPQGGLTNSISLFSAHSGLSQVIYKTDLAPFGESALESGGSHHVLKLDKDLGVGALICIESLYRKATRTMVKQGAQLLASTTSDISFGTSPMVFSHLAVSQLRALETGRDMVWSSNAGPSGHIDRMGQFTAATQFRQSQAAILRVNLYNDAPPFLMFEAPLLVLSSLLLSLLLWRLSRTAHSRPMLSTTKATGSSSLGRSVTLLVLGTVISFCYPGLVEIAQGEPSRWKAILAEVWLHKELAPLPLDSRARHLTDYKPSAAIVFWLKRYGYDTSVAWLEESLQSKTLFSDIAQELHQQEGIQTQLVDLPQDQPFYGSLLVRLRTGGLGVLCDGRDRKIGLFIPGQSGLRQYNIEELSEIVESPALGLALPSRVSHHLMP
jgi:apolipoprotein N-acyltransferase